MTADQVKSDCKAYNADFPECVADVDAGAAQVRVTYGGKQGSRSIVFTVTAGVYRNGFIAAHDPVAHVVPRRDIRLRRGIAAYAEALGKRHGDSLPVVIVARCV